MNRRRGLILCIIGLACLIYPIIQFIKFDKQMVISLQEWEVSKTPVSKRDVPSSMTYEEISENGTVIGTFKLSYHDKILPIIQGISVKDLERGLGHDPRFVMPGERGNCLIYGHREQFLWHLRDVKIGDSIFIETVKGILEFQIYETHILDPKDELIFEGSKSSILTVVTCYPFIYFGPTHERFIVKAKLINIR